MLAPTRTCSGRSGGAMRMKGLSPLVMLRDIRGALTEGEHVLGDLLLRARSPLGIETPLLSRFLSWLCT
jgi:hypothetical protein